MVLLRLLGQLTKADFHNPLAQFIVRATNPLLIPLRRIIPSIAKFDTASLLLAILLTLVEFILLKSIYDGYFAIDLLSIPETYVILLAKLSSMTIKLLISLIILKVLFSWIQAGYNPAASLLIQITEPMLSPIRRLIPISGIDISPIILLVILYTIDEITAGYLRILLEAVN